MASTKVHFEEIPTEHSGTDNGCLANLSDSDSESGSDCGRRRKSPVGLRGARGHQYTPAERLASRIVKTDTCWLVSGYRLPRTGYVQIAGAPGEGVWFAHRLAWTLAHGPIPEGQHILHRCDVTNCVKPEHLFLGSQHANIHDCIWKARRKAFGRQKLHPSDIIAIRALRLDGLTQKEIAYRFGLARHSVSGILAGKTWAHLNDALRNISEPSPAELETLAREYVFAPFHAGQSPSASARSSHPLMGRAS